MDKHLHIVTHEIPWPADYGGVVDLFYKIKAFYSLGVKIHLHCFTAEKPPQKILNNYCASVHYYTRKKGFAGFSLTTPYIVQSRSDAGLLKNLEQDNYPILLEGIHCTYFLQKNKLMNRKIFVRLHNVEYKYYQQLAKYETNIIRRAYFNMESRLLEKYEARLASKASFWAVSREDALFYQQTLHAKQVQFVPVFLPWEEVTGAAGKGSYCLYHGNLAINENEKAVEWLMKEVFNDTEIQLIIAGKSPSDRLRTLIRSNEQVSLVADPPEATMQELIQKAHINIIPSFNNTGIKLKLLNAMYNGRHCIANNAAVAGSGVEKECTIAHSAGDFKTAIKTLFVEPFTEQKMQHRNVALKDIYNSEKNALKLIAWIY